MEMNTRLQVEHPVTEMTTGIDIVQAQIRIASGEPLRLTQSDIAATGHALECRINAEDPDTCLPSPGRISRWDPPGGNGVRVDSHAHAGSVVPPYYDSLIGKLIVHAPSRAEALRRMRAALGEMRVEGVRTNIPLHLDILADDGFAAGAFDIHHLERRLQRRAAPRA
jgi:acetyl-CoA carboxylase biotin carboxylase subunit